MYISSVLYQKPRKSYLTVIFVVLLLLLILIFMSGVMKSYLLGMVGKVYICRATDKNG